MLNSDPRLLTEPYNMYLKLQEQLIAYEKELHNIKTGQADYEFVLNGQSYFGNPILEVGRLQDQLAACEKEWDSAIAALDAKITICGDEQITALKEQLAASQHYAQQLRAALGKSEREIFAMRVDRGYTNMDTFIPSTLLSLPHDTSALDALVKDAGRVNHLEAFRQKAIKRGFAWDSYVINTDKPVREQIDAAIDETMKESK